MSHQMYKILFVKYLNMSDTLSVFFLWRLSCSFCHPSTSVRTSSLGLWHSFHYKDFLSPIVQVDPASHSLHLLPFSFLLSRTHLAVAYLEREPKMLILYISERCLRSMFLLLTYTDLTLMGWLV